jgi:hypothetical protein
VALAGTVTRWSSTAVRALLARGEVAGAADVLGRHLRLRTIVGDEIVLGGQRLAVDLERRQRIAGLRSDAPKDSVDCNAMQR